jgi:serine/threonine protein kinase
MQHPQNLKQVKGHSSLLIKLVRCPCGARRVRATAQGRNGVYRSDEAYAHGQRVLHRDIKPADLLLDLRRAELISGQRLSVTSYTSDGHIAEMQRSVTR